VEAGSRNREAGRMIVVLMGVTGSGISSPSRTRMSRKGQHDSSHPGPPDSLGASILRSVRRHRGTTRGRATAARRSAPGASLPGQVRRAGEGSITATCRGKRRLVANRDAVLRWAETAANLDLLAEGLAHLPPPDTGAGLAGERPTPVTRLVRGDARSNHLSRWHPPSDPTGSV
jgi:hypothetical protein